jgi:hypothetical protein
MRLDADGAYRRQLASLPYRPAGDFSRRTQTLSAKQRRVRQRLRFEESKARQCPIGWVVSVIGIVFIIVRQGGFIVGHELADHHSE